MKKKSGIFSKIYLWVVLAFFYLPIFYVVFFSFNRSKSLTRFTGFSTKWYEAMFNNRSIMEAIWYTVLIAVIATIVSTFVGTITAIGLSLPRAARRCRPFRTRAAPCWCAARWKSCRIMCTTTTATAAVRPSARWRPRPSTS